MVISLRVGQVMRPISARVKRKNSPAPIFLEVDLSEIPADAAIPSTGATLVRAWGLDLGLAFGCVFDELFLRIVVTKNLVEKGGDYIRLPPKGKTLLTVPCCSGDIKEKPFNTLGPGGDGLWLLGVGAEIKKYKCDICHRKKDSSRVIQ